MRVILDDELSGTIELTRKLHDANEIYRSFMTCDHSVRVVEDLLLAFDLIPNKEN